MKTNLKGLAIITLTFCAFIQSRAQGYIVPNGVGYYLNGAGHYGIAVIHDPTNGYTTGFDLIAIGETLPTIYTNTYAYSPIVDIGVRVFLVAPNQPISLQPIMAGSYTELGNVPSYVFNEGLPFYLGLYTGNMTYAPRDGIYNDPLFGWARLVNNQGVIEMLDSALAYKAQGIFAGTLNLVPEPSVFTLFTFGALLLGWRFLCKRP